MELIKNSFYKKGLFLAKARGISFCSLMFLISGQLTAQTISLNEVIQTIKSNHPELKGKEANIKAITAYSKSAYNWEAPQLGAGFFMTPYKSQLWSSQNMMDGMGNNVNSPGMGQFMVQFQQMIPNPVRQTANAKYLSALSLVENEDKDAFQNELIAEAKEAYYKIALQQKRLRILRQNESLGQYALKSAQSRYALQKEKLSGIYALEVKVYEVQNQIFETENLIQESKIKLNTLMNQNIGNSFTVDTTLNILAFENDKLDTSGIASQRSDLKSLVKQLAVNELNEKNQKVQLSPDFGLRYDHMFTFGGQPQLFTLMGMVNLPFVPWANRESIANRIALKQERSSLEWQVTAAKNEIARKIESLRLEKKSKMKQYEQLGKRILPVMTKNYQTTLFAFEQNQEEISAVLDAWVSLQEVQLQYIGLLEDMINLQIQYQKELQLE